MCAVDFQVFEALARSIRHSDQRLLLRMAPDAEFKGKDYPINSINTIVNASAVSGAAIVGVCQEHSAPHMDVQVFLYDFRSSLFWQQPTKALLDQILPNWIIVDPQLVSVSNLNKLISIPGVSLRLSAQDDKGRKRILLAYHPIAKTAVASPNLSTVIFKNGSVTTERFGLAKAEATINDSKSTENIQLGMVVYDQEGQPVNLTDMPLVSAKLIAGNRYLISFSMIQSGDWQVAFVDPVTLRELTPTRLPVKVSNIMAIEKFASCPSRLRQELSFPEAY